MEFVQKEALHVVKKWKGRSSHLLLDFGNVVIMSSLFEFKDQVQFSMVFLLRGREENNVAGFYRNPPMESSQVAGGRRSRVSTANSNTRDRTESTIIAANSGFSDWIA
jgi:hypothetical protein